MSARGWETAPPARLPVDAVTNFARAHLEADPTQNDLSSKLWDAHAQAAGVSPHCIQASVSLTFPEALPFSILCAAPSPRTALSASAPPFCLT